MYYIPLLDTVLKKAMLEKPIYTCNDYEMTSLYQNIVLLSMRFIDVRKFKSNLDFLPKDDLKRLCAKVREDATILLNLRGFIYYLFQNRVSSLEEIYKGLKTFEIYKGSNLRDSIQNLDIISLIKDTNLLDAYREEIRNLPPVLTPKEAKKLCVENIKKLKPFFNMYIYKKLRFLVIANEVSQEDLMSSLISIACVNCYDLQSQYRDQHLFNSLKKAATRFGLNMIGYYTAKSRQRLTKAGDSYSNKMISTSIDESNSEDILNYVAADNEDFHNAEVSSSFRSLEIITENKYGKDSVIARLTKILGNNNKGFVLWYNQKKHTRYKEVIEIQEREKAKFTSNIQQYLGISSDRYNKVIEMLRPKLQNYL